MRQQIYELLQKQNGLSTREIFMHIAMSALFGFFIFLSYYITHRGTLYSRKFNASLVILTILTATVMTVIGNNVALSLGMVGALSIVRFRTVIKDVRDTVYIFWTIVVGICCGVGDIAVAAIGSVITFLALLLLGSVKNNNRLLIIIRGSRNAEARIQSTIYKLFEGKAKMRVKNTSDESVEFIYEITDRLLNKAKTKQANITDSIYVIGGIECVNIVMQNDEVSG